MLRVDDHVTKRKVHNSYKHTSLAKLQENGSSYDMAYT